MNGKLLIFILIFMFSSLSFGKPALAMGDKAKNYLNDRNKSDLNHLNQKKNISPKGYSYVVAVDEFSHRTMNDMKKFFSKTYSVHEVNDKVLRMKNDNIRLDLSELDSKKALCAQRMLKKILPAEYADKFKLISVDTEKSFSNSQGVKIEGYRFNFSRLFNNRVVRSKNNFLVIRTNGRGVLRDVRISLQDLKETSDIVEYEKNINENVATLDSLMSEELNEVTIVNEEGLEKKERIDNVEISSVAEAYCEILEGESKRFFPCLSYASKIKLSNNEKLVYIIDAPHSRKSWSDYQHEKKSIVRFNRYARKH